MEREPTKAQYCFGLSYPSRCRMNSLVRTPSPPDRIIDHRFPCSLPSFISSSFHDVPCHALSLVVDDVLSSNRTVPTERLRAFAGGACFRPVVDLVLEDDSINSVPALHAAQGR